MHSEFGKMIRRVHNNPGQLSTTLMTKILRKAGATNDVLEYVKAYGCGICERLKTHRPSRPAVVVRSTGPGMVIVVDVCFWKHPVTHVYSLILNVIDEASRYQVASILKSGWRQPTFGKLLD